MDELPAEGANPLDAVFEKAVRPFATGADLRAAYAPDTPVILMKKADDLPKETRELEGGGTLTVPVLAALKDSKYASKSRVSAFDFGAMDHDAVALLVLRAGGRDPEVRLVTKAQSGALLVADLDGMLGAVVSLADHPAMRAFPGGEFLVEALREGLTAAKGDLTTALTKPGPSGKSLIDEIEEAVPEEARSKGTKKASGKQPGEKAPKKGGRR